MKLNKDLVCNKCGMQFHSYEEDVKELPGHICLNDEVTE